MPPPEQVVSSPMARLPFDPSKARGPDKPPGNSGGNSGGTSGGGVPPDALSVTQLAGAIEGALAKGLPTRLKVVAEIGSFTDRTHWYFNLKDENATIDCVMFRSAARSVGFTPSRGDRVLATGRVQFYTPSGRTQLYVERIEPIGAGPLEARYRALFEQLKAEGYFDPDRKQPLPSFPRRIAIITSKTGAALQDVLDTLRRRCPAIDITLIDVTVQGERAAPSIIRAIDFVSDARERHAIDAVILTRGGGSLEDLWAFNEREVVLAVARCKVPIVAAIGHETDTTLSELAADERAATPTQAAMRLSPDRAALSEQITTLRARLTLSLRRSLSERASALHHGARHARSAVTSRIARDRLRIERMQSRLARLRPEAQHAARAARLHHLEERIRRITRHRLRTLDVAPLRMRLARAIRNRLGRESDALDALERELVVIGPARVLARGYSITTDADGKLIRSVANVRTGDLLRTRLTDGSITSTVGEGAHTLPPQPPPAPAPPRKRRRRNPPDPNQPGLFS